MEVQTRKRSVVQIQELAPPLEILKLCKKAYDTCQHLDWKLSHASFIATLYLTGMRVSEVLGLYKFMFKERKSLEKRDFIVIENVIVEKSHGKRKNVAIYPNDPIAKVLQAYLDTLDPDERLYPFTRRTALNIVYRISERRIWNHWFRAQRDSFLANAFTKDQRKKIIGWSSGLRDAEDRYSFLNWMWYADMLAKLTDSYWQSERIPEEIQSWINSLNKI